MTLYSTTSLSHPSILKHSIGINLQKILGKEIENSSLLLKCRPSKEERDATVHWSMAEIFLCWKLQTLWVFPSCVVVWHRDSPSEVSGTLHRGANERGGYVFCIIPMYCSCAECCCQPRLLYNKNHFRWANPGPFSALSPKTHVPPAGWAYGWL